MVPNFRNTVCLLTDLSEQYDAWCRIANIYFGIGAPSRERLGRWKNPCVRLDGVKGSSADSYYKRNGWNVIGFLELLTKLGESNRIKTDTDNLFKKMLAKTLAHNDDCYDDYCDDDEEEDDDWYNESNWGNPDYRNSEYSERITVNIGRDAVDMSPGIRTNPMAHLLKARKLIKNLRDL